MNIDGTEPMRLTYAPQAETHPCWSPDGSQIAFVHWRGDGTSGIHVVPAEGGTPQQLIAAGDRCADPAWCPVRDEVVFVVGRGNAVWGDLWFIDALAGTLLSQWKYTGREMEPTWSPDGTMVCCSHSRRREGEHADLMVFDVNTRDIWQVTKGTAMDREPDWWMPEQ
jgi:TolB protein